VNGSPAAREFTSFASAPGVDRHGRRNEYFCRATGNRNLL
jgi:hypothetical protein